MRWFSALIIFLFLFQNSEGRIRLRKVKEAPKTCKTMEEDRFLSRDDKKVLGTLRHSVLIEDDEHDQSITLVKDKGEKVCQWNINQWAAIQTDNKLPDIKSFKFYIDEYKNVIYPYVQKKDKSYFVMSIPIQTCDLSNQYTNAKLQLPKCEKPVKRKIRYAKKKSTSKKRSIAKAN